MRVITRLTITGLIVTGPIVALALDGLAGHLDEGVQIGHIAGRADIIGVGARCLRGGSR